jgi:alkylated DNA repair dioxygenase AlkB
MSGMQWQLPDDGQLQLISHFIPDEQCEALFAQVHAAVMWRTQSIQLAGRWIEEPRRTAWVGDADAAYTYSGRRNVPEPWPAVLQTLREQVCEVAQEPLNSVLCNLYRDGHDSMGLHADAEPELGPAPVIASLSLGATRRFQLRHRKLASARLDLDLARGSLLIMRGALQRFYRHGVPKQLRVDEPRINLTFRRIMPLTAGQGSPR